MRRSFVSLIAALAALAGMVPAAHAGGAPPTVWVALEDAGQGALVNVRTGSVVRRVRTPGGPHNITAGGDGVAGA